MPARLRFYEFFRGGRTGSVRLVIVDFLLFWTGAVGFYLLDAAMQPYPEFLFDVWAGFITGMIMLILFNILVELLGKGHEEWRAQNAARKTSAR